jgi:hypothetical protein
MICALLIFRTPELPAPLSQLSPWLDELVVPRDEVFAQLAAQEHRRFVKTHTPLHEMTIAPRATYIVVARHPLDAAVSLFHQLDNIDSAPIRQPSGGPEPDRQRLSLLRWIGTEAPAQEERTSLPGVMRHLSDAWARRGEPNVVLLHYEDLSADLEGEMRRLAARLGVTVPDELWAALVKAATSEHMRAAADRLQPLGIPLKSNAAFFRRGTSGLGRELLTSAEFARYHARTARLASPDLLAWLHRQNEAEGAPEP